MKKKEKLKLKCVDNLDKKFNYHISISNNIPTWDRALAYETCRETTETSTLMLNNACDPDTYIQWDVGPAPGPIKDTIIFA